MIQGCMSSKIVPKATIVLTAEERTELESLARSMKTDDRRIANQSGG